MNNAIRASYGPDNQDGEAFSWDVHYAEGSPESGGAESLEDARAECERFGVPADARWVEDPTGAYRWTA